ncbi:MAG: nucleotidyltransferase family protein, partial [Candidatus Methanoperedenaceae archaeon]|nr:nucleotidyltransferase family protein [Candidatus Methanoperedenaceae archaeon]
MLAIPKNLNWSRIEFVVTLYNLESIFHYVLREEQVPKSLITQWNQVRMTTLYKNARSLNESIKIFKILSDKAIPVVCFRGLAMANCHYPDPGLRPMEDVDLLIRSEDRDGAADLMEIHGFHPAKLLRSQLVYHINDTIFEIHWSFLTPKRFKAAIDSETFLGSRQTVDLKEGRIYRLSYEHELIGLVAHSFSHHELHSLIQLVDIALFMVRSDINWEYIVSWCGQAHLTNMFLFTFTLINHVFALGLEKKLECFEQTLPHRARKACDAYMKRFFGKDNLIYYIRRKKNLLFIAESP